MALRTEIERETSRSRKWIRGDLIGAGASATVSLAINNSNGELFAVKSMRADCISCLENEYNILKSLDSPYVVKCTGMDSSVDNGEEVCNLLMEYMPGGSVAELMKKFGGRLEESVIRAYSGCILRGLEYLHGQGIVHCDIKAKNVLVGTGGVKIADFGSAKKTADMGGSTADPWQFRGTPLWMAPEVVNQVEQGPASDIWSLGCTLVEMATGAAPWSNVRESPLAAMYRIGCSDELPEFPLWVSPQGRDFLDKCLRRDPAQRWTAAQLLTHPFLCEKTCSDDVKPPLSPRSALDLEHSVWDSCSSCSSSTVPTSSLDISKPDQKIDSENEEKAANLTRPLKSSPKARVIALAAGCERPAWCSTPSSGQWVVVRSSSDCLQTINGNSILEAECGSSLESSDEKLQSTDGSPVAEGEEGQLQLDQLPSWPITENLIDLAKETHENSSENVYAPIQYRAVGGNIIHHSVIRSGQNLTLSFDLYSAKICPKLFFTGQLYINFTTNICKFSQLIEPLLIWVHVLSRKIIVAVNLTDSNPRFLLASVSSKTSSRIPFFSYCDN